MSAREPDSPALDERIDVMREFLLRLAREDEGQDLIEYAMLAGFIAFGLGRYDHEYRRGRERRLQRCQR